MNTAKRVLAAGFVAAALLVAPMGLSITTGDAGVGITLASTASTAHARPRRPVEAGPMEPSAFGSAECDTWADVINQDLAAAQQAQKQGNTAKARSAMNDARKHQDHALDEGCLIVNPV